MKGQEVARQLRETTKNETIDLLVADLALQQQVRTLPQVSAENTSVSMCS